MMVRVQGQIAGLSLGANLGEAGTGLEWVAESNFVAG